MDDERWMREALVLAEKGRGQVSPNPLVGAVVVKHGKILGHGYHARFGSAHAETVALLEAGGEAKGATLYVTLEPCSHFGKTPPCTNCIIDSGITRVVIGHKDLNPLVNGRGIEELKKAGMAVEVGLLAKEVRQQNEWYFKYVTKKTPFVLLKLSSTLDGKIATRSGESRWVSSYEGRVYAHKLRSEMDAILVGIGTILNDNPKLTTRLVKGRNPVRVVLDANLKIPFKANVLKGTGKVIVFTNRPKGIKGKKLAKMGVAVVGVSRDSMNKNYLDWKEVLKELGKRSIISIIIEGGATVASSALKAGVVDKIAIVYGPKILGTGLAFSDGLSVKHLHQALEIKSYGLKSLGKDFLFEGYLCSRA